MGVDYTYFVGYGCPVEMPNLDKDDNFDTMERVLRKHRLECFIWGGPAYGMPSGRIILLRETWKEIESSNTKVTIPRDRDWNQVEASARISEAVYELRQAKVDVNIRTDDTGWHVCCWVS